MSVNSSLVAGAPHTSASVIGRIEAALEGVVDALANAGELKLPFSSRRHRARPQNRVDRYVSFPGSSAQEARKFARVLLVMKLSHQALITGTVLTKRHIYYQHQQLFETQRNVDELVDDLAYTLGTDRDDLNITASSKGSVSGCIIIHLQSGEVIDASLGGLGAAVPWSRSISKIEAPNAKWLLVVEKHAVFRSLEGIRFWETALSGRGILVTAKGYPDLMTRNFLVHVETLCPNLPLFVLSDFDPDGLNIFSCYRYGAKNFSHESSNTKINLGWLGIHSGHLGFIYSDRTAAVTGATIQNLTWSEHRLLNLTSRDRACAVRILRASSHAESDPEHVLLRRELQVMLMLGTKAEIQALDDNGDITSWLDNALQNALTFYN